MPDPISVASIIAALAGINQLTELIKNESQEYKKAHATQLLQYLEIISFNDIDNVLRKIVEEKKITDSSRNKLKNWYRKTQNELETAKSKLGNYYAEHGNSGYSILNLKSFSLPRDWINRSNYIAIKLQKEGLRGLIHSLKTDLLARNQVEELTPQEIIRIELLRSHMKEMNEKIRPLYDSLRRLSDNNSGS